MRIKERSVANSVAVENLASAHLESWLVPDLWHYLIDKDGTFLFDGKDINGESNPPIRKFFDTTTQVGEDEDLAVVRMQNWAKERTAGVILWPSPVRPDIGYNLTKYQIGILTTQNGEKQLENVAILTHHTGYECLKIAQTISSLLSPNKITLLNPEALRANPIPITLPIGTSWIDVLSKYIPAPNAWEKIKTDVHIREKEEARIFYGRLAEENPIENDTVLLTRGGANPSGRYSCLLRASEFFLVNSRVYWEYHHGTCRLCKSLTEVGPCNICKICEKKFNPL